MIPGYYQRDGGQRCAPTHKKMLMDRVTEKVQLESQRIFPTTPSQWPFPLHELRHVYDHQSRTGEQISLMTLSRPQGTIAANAGSSLRTAVSCKKKTQKTTQLLPLLEIRRGATPARIRACVWVFQNIRWKAHQQRHHVSPVNNKKTDDKIKFGGALAPSSDEM